MLCLHNSLACHWPVHSLAYAAVLSLAPYTPPTLLHTHIRIACVVRSLYREGGSPLVIYLRGRIL